MNEKNTVAAAAVTPAMPAWPLLVSALKKGVKLSTLKAGRATAAKNSKTAILMTTMMVLIAMDSRAPRNNNTPHMAIRITGGRLNRSR